MEKMFLKKIVAALMQEEKAKTEQAKAEKREFLTEKEVIKRFHTYHYSLAVLVKKGLFPAGEEIAPGVIVWRRQTLDRFAANLLAANGELDAASKEAAK